jgi:hypothetical protein
MKDEFFGQFLVIIYSNDGFLGDIHKNSAGYASSIVPKTITIEHLIGSLL